MNILVTGGWYESREHLDDIRKLGHTVYFLEKESDALPCDPAIIDGVVCCKVFNWHPVEEFTNLKFIQSESVGYDRMPVAYAKEHGIKLHNVKDTYARPMSEYIIGHILEVYQDIKQEHANRVERGFNRNHDKRELTGKTVCIIGTGNIAKFTAKKLQAFECKVIAITHTVRDVEYIDEVRPYDRLGESLAEADILVMAAPPTGHPVIGAAELAMMKESAVLVNVSRGTELDQAALACALREGRLSAAVLDVFEQEPLPADSELWSIDNLIITPHVSYIGEGNAERLWQTIRNTLEEYL